MAAQTSKSQAIIAMLCRSADCDPGPALFVQPASDEAVLFGETRIKPTLEDSPKLRYLIPNDKRKNYQTDNYRLPGMNVHLIGAGSPSKMASKPIRFVFMDEVDKYPEDFTREGDPVDLIDQRTKTYGDRRKVVITSTPTHERGTITTEFYNGDQRRFYVTCDSCRSSHVLAFENIKFEHEGLTPCEAASTARYVCPSCGKKFNTREKDSVLVAHGEWRPTAKPKIKGCASFHIESIAAPWVTLQSIVEKWLVAKRGGKTKLRAFINSELAQPWIEADEKIHASLVRAREAEYAEGESFPYADDGDRQRFAGVDVQKSELVLIVREYARGGASGLVYKTKIQGSSAEQFMRLDKELERFNVFLCAIDARYRTDDVYNACATYQGMVPAHGSRPFRDGSIWQQSTVSRNRMRGRDGEIAAILYDQSAVFDNVALGISGDAESPPWYIYKGAADDVQYSQEITAKTKTLGNWSADEHVDDHYADAEKLAELCAIINGYRIPINADVTQSVETDA